MIYHVGNVTLVIVGIWLCGVFCLNAHKGYCCAFRTKALVLELLAAVCLVRGGHEIILSAFDNFKEVEAGTFL